MGARRRSPAPGRAGVSLLAMLLVLTIMAVAAGLAIPAFFGLHSVTLESAVRLLSRDLHMAQNMAAFDRRPCRFQFLSEGRGWRVVDASGNVVQRPDQDGLFERDFSADGVFEGVRLESIDFDGGSEIHYDKNARALPGGTLRVSFDGRFRVVRVMALTGRVILDGIADEYSGEGH
jgi:Tfp pilus assembly protein FimT